MVLETSCECFQWYVVYYEERVLICQLLAAALMIHMLTVLAQPCPVWPRSVRASHQRATSSTMQLRWR